MTKTIVSGGEKKESAEYSAKISAESIQRLVDSEHMVLHGSDEQMQKYTILKIENSFDSGGGNQHAASDHPFFNSFFTGRNSSQRYDFYVVINQAIDKQARGGQGYIAPAFRLLFDEENDEWRTVVAKDSEEFIVKIFDLTPRQGEPQSLRLEDAQNEAAIVARYPWFRSKPIVVDQTCAYLIMKKIPGKDLFQMVNGAQNELDELDASERTSIALQIVLALYDLHKGNLNSKGSIIHRDIKLENIMCYRDEHGHYNITIIDYGLSLAVSHSKVSEVNDALEPYFAYFRNKYATDIPIHFSKRVQDDASIDDSIKDEITNKGIVSDGLQRGNIGGSPIEAVFKIYGPKSDIYSLLPILLIIFGVQNPFKYKEEAKNSGQNSIEKRYSFSGFCKENYFPTSLTDVKRLLKSFLEKMGSLAYDARPNDDELLLFFTNLHKFRLLGEKNLNNSDEACVCCAKMVLAQQGLCDKFNGFILTADIVTAQAIIYFYNNFPDKLAIARDEKELTLQLNRKICEEIISRLPIPIRISFRQDYPSVSGGCASIFSKAQERVDEMHSAFNIMQAAKEYLVTENVQLLHEIGNEAYIGKILNSDLITYLQAIVSQEPPLKLSMSS